MYGSTMLITTTTGVTTLAFTGIPVARYVFVASLLILTGLLLLRFGHRRASQR
jgi:hypothetical protein